MVCDCIKCRIIFRQHISRKCLNDECANQSLPKSIWYSHFALQLIKLEWSFYKTMTFDFPDQLKKKCFYNFNGFLLHVFFFICVWFLFFDCFLFFNFQLHCEKFKARPGKCGEPYYSSTGHLTTAALLSSRLLLFVTTISNIYLILKFIPNVF